MQESSLHAALKDFYTRGEQDAQEVPVDGYLVDVVSGELLIEIQTGNFSALKEKLPVLLAHHPVLLVHPIAQEKWIVHLAREGTTPLKRRKSPRRGRVEHLFLELVRIPHLVAHPNFSLEVLLTREEEIQRADGKGSWRRKGRSISDRRLLEVVQRVRFDAPQDFIPFLPASLPQEFTSRELGQTLGIPSYLAQKTIYCLRAMRVIHRVGKQRRAFLYSRATEGRSIG